MTIPAHKGFWKGNGPGAFIIKTQGLAEFDKILKTLPHEMQQKCINNALKAGANEVIPAIKGNIISETGALRNSIRTKVLKQEGTKCTVQIGPFLETAKIRTKTGYKFDRPFYAHMIEWGTKAHNAKASVFERIRSSGGTKNKLMRFLSKNYGGWVSKESVRGIERQRPFTRGFDEKKTAFIWQYTDYVGRFITKYINSNAPKIIR